MASGPGRGQCGIEAAAALPSAVIAFMELFEVMEKLLDEQEDAAVVEQHAAFPIEEI